MTLAGERRDLAPPAPPAPPRRRRRRWVLPAVGASAVVGAAALVPALGSDEQPPPPAAAEPTYTSVWGPAVREDFDTDVALGDFPASAYTEEWGVYPDGWADTSGLGTYAPTRVLSVEDGVLTWDIRTEGGQHLGAGLTSLSTYGQEYGRFSVRFRADPVPGFGLAFLLWPDSEQWPADGEIDFPEGHLDGTLVATAHHADPAGGKDQFETGVGMGEWQVATIEWTPDEVVFHLDNRMVGRSVTDVPSNPMHWVMQAGTNGTGTPPPADVQGLIEVDWVQVEPYVG
jgi:beta-glucanase (GH16 family)